MEDYICNICCDNIVSNSIYCIICRKSICIKCSLNIKSNNSISSNKTMYKNKLYLEYKCPFCRSCNLKELYNLNKDELIANINNDFINFNDLSIKYIEIVKNYNDVIYKNVEEVEYLKNKINNLTLINNDNYKLINSLLNKK